MPRFVIIGSAVAVALVVSGLLWLYASIAAGSDTVNPASELKDRGFGQIQVLGENTEMGGHSWGQYKVSVDACAITATWRESSSDKSTKTGWQFTSDLLELKDFKPSLTAQDVRNLPDFRKHCFTLKP